MIEKHLDGEMVDLVVTEGHVATQGCGYGIMWLQRVIAV